MKNKSVKLVSIVLSLLMVMSVFSAVTVFAETFSGNDNGISWTYDADTCTLTLSGEGALPKDGEWDTYAHDVKILNIEHGITSLPELAFSTPYTDLEAVSLPGSMVTIGAQAFQNCDNLATVDFGGTVEIGDRAFQSTDLKSIELPYTIEKIGEMAFDDCSNLKTVDLADVRSVGKLAFADTAINSIYLPDALEDIGEKAFGYYYDEPIDDEGTTSLFGWYPLQYFEIHVLDDNFYGAKYAKENGFTLCIGSPSISPKSASIKAGASKKITVTAAAVTSWTSSNKKVAIVKKGTVYGLKKGSATITAKLLSGKKLTCKVKVTTNPTIKVNGKKFKASTRYPIKKGKTIKVTITGKSSKVKNVYSSTKKKIAKVISKTTAKTVKIKGYKKGGATITIKVNGVAFKVKVKVK